MSAPMGGNAFRFKKIRFLTKLTAKCPVMLTCNNGTEHDLSRDVDMQQRYRKLPYDHFNPNMSRKGQYINPTTIEVERFLVVLSQ